MAWFSLLIAGLLEVVWTCSMKQSEGFTKPLPAAITLITIMASLGLLSYSMRTLPLGTAYTVWSGIGAVGAFVIGIVLFGEALNPTRVIAALLIVCGLVLLKMSTH